MLRFRDPDGDPVVIESDAIVAVTLGQVQGPIGLNSDPAAAGRSPHTVTLIHTQAGPLLVAEDLELVLDRWSAAYAVRREVEAHAAAR